ncbi:M23 family metallopeptidase [Priestia megaterium]|uniref:M23 family metallopeptidase n=1 Tax=Priestia megaterium TaxID=1404 RepID=UPI00299F55D7|nr:M23 family metallopeptidase [Priestia megaterium]
MRKTIILLFMFMSIFTGWHHVTAESSADQEKILIQKRLELYKQMEAATTIPWYYFAGVDQYERNIRRSHKDIPREKGAIAIYYPPEKWSGSLNPDLEDTNPLTISLLGGMGKDGNGDKKADQFNDEDMLFTMADYIRTFGVSEDYIKIALWNYYHRAKAVDIILGNAKIFRHYGRIDLKGSSFPVPLRANYSYRSTWGDARGWGGKRIHEGTDIFADYGVPVKSPCYGIIELKGWNKYGGWRIGIRDLHNNYHYLAHLSGFAKNLKVGQIVEPGTLIGGVGSSGYGPPGTSGKFPPHLHYGMYKDNGKNEWSFDPYPQLRTWERNDRLELKKK